MTKDQEKLLRKHAQKFGEVLDEAQRLLKEKLPFAGEMHKILPEGELPHARISYNDATDEDTFLDNVTAVVKGRSDRILPPGKYTRLITKWPQLPPGESEWCIMMSDAPYEIRSSMEFIENAKGVVLVTGLGLGVTLLPVLAKKTVKTVFVVENNRDVIDLVYPHIRKQKGGEKLHIIFQDAMAFRPAAGMRYDTIWLDIWPSVDTANLPAMRVMRKYYRRWLRPGGWIGVWEWDYLHKQKAKLDKEFAAMFAPVGGIIKEAKKAKKVGGVKL